jgi:hypothetical protein
MSKLISLSKGKYVLVDDDDFEWLNQYKWYFHRSGYATRGYRINKAVKMVLMHREILKPPQYLETDHINGNKLDNRRINLRIATTQQNQFNRGNPINNTSGYKGVDWNKQIKRWRATMYINGKPIHLGYFDKKTDAAIAYNQLAGEVQGEFSRLNIL